MPESLPHERLLETGARYEVTHILHQHQKSGFLRLMQPETLDYSLMK
jgi:hypothetical protein